MKSTYVGGSLGENASSLNIAADGTIYVAGSTTSTNYPVGVTPYDSTANGSGDIIVTKLDPTLANISQSTDIGGAVVETICETAFEGE